MASREDLYDEAARTYGAALDRLARAYESDPDQQRDLLQDIHLSLWRSFSNFDGRCSLRTWIYRVAHNVAASHVASDRRARSRHLLSIDESDQIDLADPNSNTAQSAESLDYGIEQAAVAIRRQQLRRLQHECAADDDGDDE